MRDADELTQVRSPGADRCGTPGMLQGLYEGYLLLPYRRARALSPLVIAPGPMLAGSGDCAGEALLCLSTEG